jgi:protein-tyrosine kinase
MSRIDEALKRASVGVAEARRDPADHAPVVRPADESLLEQYPREARSTQHDSIGSFGRDEAAPAAFERVAVERPAPERAALERVAPGERVATEIATRRPVALRPVAVKEPPRPVTSAFDSKLVLGGEVPPMLVEQYRRLAASIHELQLERGLKTLAVTSAVPREGKSLTVANLALTLSESYGRRVLLIDADLRRPSLHELFGLSNATGLGDVLRSDRRDLPLVKVTPLLSVLPAGEPGNDAVAGITSDRMRALLEEAATEYDWVLLDAPPVAVMPDAALLAGMTRAIVLVIAAGSTPYAQVARAIDELGRDCIVGTVLNKIEDRNIPDTTFYRAYHEPAATR